MGPSIIINRANLQGRVGGSKIAHQLLRDPEILEHSTAAASTQKDK